MSTPVLFIDKIQSKSMFGKFEVENEDIISNMTYDEQILLRTFNGYDDVGKILLYKAAISIAIVGYGNGNYGKIRHDGEIYELKDIFDKYKIKYNRTLNEKYKENELNPRRLVRLFRFQIKEYITRTNRPSYMWIKYSDHNEKMMSICFQNSENVVETVEQAIYIYNVYKTMDERLNTTFVNRFKRTMAARGFRLNYKDL